MQEIDNRSLTSRAFEQLRADIIGATLKPNERLRIQALSERYGVGATAIREALSRLVPEGLVVFEDQRGFCVAPMSRAELLDLSRIRIDVESLALGYAVQRGDIQWESDLISAFHRLSRTLPPFDSTQQPIWAEAHRQFHAALIAGCGSPTLIRLCSLLYDQSERYRNFANDQRESAKRDVGAEHKDLLDAALARNAEELTKLLASHFNRTTEIIQNVDFMEQGSGARAAGARTSSRA
ncbi:GntR family transcriptional regulator [Hydrogenophaga sp.]|uniref:GntR family transcriptional regulator n=1 Tax=Hydrogenophaga sp. TaxID=1904254 RepID=UPI002720F08D|nr:FCD domain-containing protein [Hydrogenophaga sp.]MDO9603202.1 FCD domain-containing protein [Hydrogenophaga sp.]